MLSLMVLARCAMCSLDTELARALAEARSEAYSPKPRQSASALTRASRSHVLRRSDL